MVVSVASELNVLSVSLHGMQLLSQFIIATVASVRCRHSALSEPTVAALHQSQLKMEMETEPNPSSEGSFPSSFLFTDKHDACFVPTLRRFTILLHIAIKRIKQNKLFLLRYGCDFPSATIQFTRHYFHFRTEPNPKN